MIVVNTVLSFPFFVMHTIVIIILHALLKYFFLQDIAMVLVFALGYAGIIFEESLAFNKSGVGILMAVCLWVVRSIGVSYSVKQSSRLLKQQLQDFSNCLKIQAINHVF